MDSPPWYFQQGVPATNDIDSNGAKGEVILVLHASTFDVILQRLMPLLWAEAVWRIHDFVAESNAY